MSELGKSLAQARVARGLTLEDCERDTRISKRYLDALEREDWKVFPAPVYSRAFLRTYAQYLGLDPAYLMRQFQSQTEEPEFKPLPEVRPAPATGSINMGLAGAVVGVLLIIGLGVYLFGGGLGGDDSDGSLAQNQPTTAPEAQGGGPQPAVGRPIGEIVEGEVPDLTGVRLDDAMTALSQAELNYIVVETDTVTGTAEVVVSQDPAPGTDAGSDTSVTLVVPRS